MLTKKVFRSGIFGQIFLNLKLSPNSEKYYAKNGIQISSAKGETIAHKQTLCTNTKVS